MGTPTIRLAVFLLALGSGPSVSAATCVGIPNGCDDGNACTVDHCDPQTGQCVHAPLDCEDGNECTDDACDPASGCTSTPDDTNTCFEPEPCWVGVCSDGACHSELRDCDDGNACSMDRCVPSSGQCLSTAISCNDGNPCTDDSCSPATGCVFAPDGSNSCSDGNACTDDACSPTTGQCGSVTDDANACSDGNACTSDHCAGGTCVSAAQSCDDGQACTADSCSPATGCIHAAPACDDHNPCTVDSCTDQGGCFHAPEQDGAYCHTSTCMIYQWCRDGICQGGSMDGSCVGFDSPCLRKFCNPQGGCELEVRNCDDGTSCTFDSCDRDFGWCNHYVTGCTDGACEVLDVRFASDRKTLSWSAPGLTCGDSSAVYFYYYVAKGLISQLPSGADVTNEECSLRFEGTFTDAKVPEPGEGYWYLARAYYRPSPETRVDFPWGWQARNGSPTVERQTAAQCPGAP